MRTLFKALWNDDRGFVVTAEAALLATLGIAGATIGVKLAAESVDQELRDVAYAFRSLNQSYSYKGFRGCGAATAGSSFRQQSVEGARRDLHRLEQELDRRQRDREQAEREERRRDEQRQPPRRKPRRDDDVNAKSQSPQSDRKDVSDVIAP